MVTDGEGKDFFIGKPPRYIQVNANDVEKAVHALQTIKSITNKLPDLKNEIEVRDYINRVWFEAVSAEQAGNKLLMEAYRIPGK